MIKKNYLVVYSRLRITAVSRVRDPSPLSKKGKVKVDSKFVLN